MHRAALAVLCILLASAFCWRGACARLAEAHRRCARRRNWPSSRCTCLISPHDALDAGWAATDGYRVQFSPVTAGKALGSVLVLDVGSMSIRLPMQPPISVPTPQECQLRCAALPGAVTVPLR